MNRKILVFSILMAATPGLSADSSVYKWTDENGVTQFGDRQPTGKKAEKINVRSGTSRSANSDRATPQERLSEIDGQQQATAERKQETAVEEANRKQREANCETAKTNLKVISSNARIRVEENGELRYLSPEEIDAQREQFEAFAEENCGPAVASNAE
ncbi:DUF4124 domain-containing protein [Marinobacter sp.]|uniref:DUF4124 domain-containing protein n=1 Tax=Marinobacter sp. TaxID=50741 RepID=UPI002B27C0C8|nr:DUF4124 domain-containing protein [Marinobacter sp.]